MSRQSHKPCPPPFFLSLQKQLSMWLPPLATQAPTSHIFRSTSFQRPPAPVADASTSLPLLAAQADQALQPFPPNITNHVACSRSKREAASACNTGPHILFTLLLLTPFFFFSCLQLPSRCQREVASASGTEYTGSAGRLNPNSHSTTFSSWSKL